MRSRVDLLVQVADEVRLHVFIGQLFEQDRRESQRQTGGNAFRMQIVERIEQRNVAFRSRLVDPFFAMRPAACLAGVGDMRM